MIWWDDVLGLKKRGTRWRDREREGEKRRGRGGGARGQTDRRQREDGKGINAFFLIKKIFNKFSK
jgi:hypothetical protein